MKQQDKVFMAVGGGVVTALAALTGVYLFGDNDSSTATQAATTSLTTSGATTSASDANSTTSTSTDKSTSSNSTSTTSSSYKDGTYSASIDYSVPHGTNSLTAKLTIKDGTVTAVNVDNDYSDNESGMYIDSFENAIQGAVVGQDVGSLSLSRLAGASLTTQAFNNALTTIRNDAKA